MPTGDEADRQETQRRVDAAIARASACHMNDTKWRKLFAALRELGVAQLRWKFVRDERIFVAPMPPADAMLDHTLGDVLPYPYGPYREIEWIEIPANHAARVPETLVAIGQFHLQQVDSGLRVIAYTW